MELRAGRLKRSPRSSLTFASRHHATYALSRKRQHTGNRTWEGRNTSMESPIDLTRRLRLDAPGSGEISTCAIWESWRFAPRWAAACRPAKPYLSKVECPCSAVRRRVGPVASTRGAIGARCAGDTGEDRRRDLAILFLWRQHLPHGTSWPIPSSSLSVATAM